jgi:hypothetical protein
VWLAVISQFSKAGKSSEHLRVCGSLTRQAKRDSFHPSSSLSPPIHDRTYRHHSEPQKAIELVFHSFYSFSTIASQSCSKIRGSFAQRHARYSYSIHDQTIPGEVILRVSFQRQLPETPRSITKKSPRPLGALCGNELDNASEGPDLHRSWLYTAASSFVTLID